jgi:glycosyltransferase involved in cell wall biosynthesis
MKFSIIITCFNREKLISRCIRSALHQKNVNRYDYEIIVIDDFSSDRSLEKINEFDSLVRVVLNKKNYGLAFSRNVGLRKAKGKYVVMLDSDDFLSENFLFISGLFLESNAWDAAATDYFKVDLKGEKIKKESAKKNPIACGILFKKKCLEIIKFYNPKLRINEEVDLMKRFLKKFKLGFINLPLYRYTKHRKSLTGIKKNNLN